MAASGTIRFIGFALGVLGALYAPAAGQSFSSAGKSASSVPTARDARIGGDEKHTRFILDLSSKVDLRTFTLADPYRVVIDLPQIDFQLPPRSGENGRGLVKAFRFGLVMQGGSRIVLDMHGPVRVDRAFVLDPSEEQPARLVLDLTAVDRATFMRAAAIDNQLPRERPQKPKIVTPSGDVRPVIVIDPGHGGIDNGARAPNGKTEKELTLAFALTLRDKLEKTGRYRAVLTRSDDIFMSLDERVHLARAHGAQLFISIHCDALPRNEGEAEGASVYTLSEKATDAEAARLAEDENRADAIAGLDLSSEPNDIADILIDLAQRETRTFSTQFAHHVVQEMKTSTRLHKHPLKSAGFRVLKAPDVPSVLVELGYVSSNEDLRNLTSEAWRSRTSDAMVQSVNVYFRTRIAGAKASR